jgi:putative peptide zinc metalloprotease protein
LAVCAATLVLLLGVLMVPAPFRSQAQGVVWLPEQSAVRAGANGFLSEVLVGDGERVTRGEPVMTSVDPMLYAQIRLAEARVAELEASYTREFVNNRAGAEIVGQRLVAERAALDRSRERADGLIVRAGADGVFHVPQAGDLAGRFHRKGQLLGYVVDGSQPVARVVVTQDEVDQVQLGTDRVELRLAGHPERAIAGRVLRQVPAGEDHLPTKVLAIEGGGNIAVDPRDSSGTRTLARTFQLDVELPPAAGPNWFGERVYVRFDHKKAPLATQWYRAVRRLLLTRFSV